MNGIVQRKKEEENVILGERNGLVQFSAQPGRKRKKEKGAKSGDKHSRQITHTPNKTTSSNG